MRLGMLQPSIRNQQGPKCLSTRPVTRGLVFGLAINIRKARDFDGQCLFRIGHFESLEFSLCDIWAEDVSIAKCPDHVQVHSKKRRQLSYPGGYIRVHSFGNLSLLHYLLAPPQAGYLVIWAIATTAVFKSQA